MDREVDKMRSGGGGGVKPTPEPAPNPDGEDPAAAEKPDAGSGGGVRANNVQFAKVLADWIVRIGSLARGERLVIHGGWSKKGTVHPLIRGSFPFERHRSLHRFEPS